MRHREFPQNRKSGQSEKKVGAMNGNINDFATVARKFRF